MSRLTIHDHSRESAGMTYVYPVLSRRAGGISVGINLNPNNACNWQCIYCQVPDLQRGGPPAIDLQLLECELRELLVRFCKDDCFDRQVPADMRKVVDIAFSGNGEPTSAAEFSEAVFLVRRVVDDLALQETLRLRLITNGSLLDRLNVQHGIAEIGRCCGEVWFKVDAVSEQDMMRTNRIAYEPATVLRRLRLCGKLCPTWVQTCWFALDGYPPGDDDFSAFIDLLAAAKDSLAGVHLYGIARPSRQQEASRLSALPPEWFEARADVLRLKTGLSVQISP